MLDISVTLDRSHLEISPLNTFVPANVWLMAVTRDTSHLEMSPLNDVEARNMLDMSVIEETSQPPIGPCAPLAQVPTEGCCRLMLMVGVGNRV